MAKSRQTQTSAIAKEKDKRAEAASEVTQETKEVVQDETVTNEVQDKTINKQGNTEFLADAVVEEKPEAVEAQPPKQDYENIIEDTDEEDEDEPHSIVEEVKPVADARVDDEKAIVDVQSKVSSEAHPALDMFIRYMEDMRPGRTMDTRTGAAHQAKLFQCFYIIINNLSDADFRYMWTFVLDMFEKHKDGVFNEIYVFRFPEYWPLSLAERTAFKRWINLACVTRKASTRRAAAKQITNWNEILETQVTEDGRRHLEDFYQF